MVESDPFNWKESLIVSAAIEAGEIGMKYFCNDATDVWYKTGNSPVSQADQEIDQFLRQSLTDIEPDFGWLSEETEDNLARLQCQKLFVVDPIDGTRGFINCDKRWCISIAIVENGRPIEGVLHAPALGETLYARSGHALYMEGKSKASATTKRQPPLVTGSKKLIEAIDALCGAPMKVMPFIPSLAYRLGLVASGELDGAFARSGASEWDIAAADIILEAAGCQLTDKNGKKICYNQKNVTAPPLIAASGSNHARILTLANSTGILQ